MVLDTMGETTARNGLEMSLTERLGVCLMPSRGFGNREVANAFARPRPWPKEEDEPGLIRCLARPGTVSDDLGGLRTARDQAVDFGSR